jgi:uncharacterized membrane protein
MSLLPLAEWLDTHAWSTALHESLYMYPLVESTHVLSVMLFVGLAVMLDLRLLGKAFTGAPVSEVQKKLFPWTLAGFVVMAITGVLLFYAIPVRTYQSVWFRAKLIFLVLAAVNVWYFHTRTYQGADKWDLNTILPPAARRAGAASLVLWALVVVAGRMIAYNWFDCDLQPQSDFVNWFAGCVVPPQ